MDYFVIGEREIVIGFNLVGVQGEVAVTAEEARAAFRRLTGTNRLELSGGAGNSRTGVAVDSAIPVTAAGARPRILILTEDVSTMIEEDVLSWQMTGKFPLVVEIPGLQGRIEGKQTLTDAIREAIGISV